MAERREGLTQQDLANNEVLDDPADPSITPIEPRCRKCGNTFSSEADLAEHVKTCKGGGESGVKTHLR
jgi:hypothetical protein